MRDEVEVTKQTYSKIYQEYANNNENLNEAVQTNLDKFISLLSGKEVLDVGCAQGRESKYLSDHGLNIIGCDLTTEFIELAKQNCPKCQFKVMDMRTLDFTPDSFDGLWVSASFLHIPKEDAQKTLKGFARILKTSGVLYISVMKGDFNGLRQNKQMNWGERHFSDYEPEELADLLVKEQLQVIETKEINTNWGPTFLHYFCKKQ